MEVPAAFTLPVARPPLPQCEACSDGRHGECFDIEVNAGAVDALDFVGIFCGCVEGDCAPDISWACASWLHNCGGCPCECHADPKVEAAVRECWQRWFDATVGARLDEAFGAAGSTTPTPTPNQETR